MKTLMEEIEKSQLTGPCHFIKFLQVRFPEKTKHIDVTSLTVNSTNKDTRKALLRFIGVFHPDK